jgi:hypothetical protein
VTRSRGLPIVAATQEGENRSRGTEPEDWRRHYLLGQRTPPSGAMFLGGRVDDAISTYYRRGSTGTPGSARPAFLEAPRVIRGES